MPRQRDSYQTKQLVSFDERPAPPNFDGSRIDYFRVFDQIEVWMVKVAKLPVTNHTGREAQVFTCQRRAVMPADPIANAPRCLHAAIRRDLPQPILHRRKGLTQTR